MGRAGVGAVELVVALILFGAVVHGAWRVFAGQRRSSEELRLRTEVLDADRAVRVVLGAELAAGVAGRDWAIPASGVVELRAFRGWAVVCPGVDGGDAFPVEDVVVAYRGLRLADPDKDSVLVLREDGAWTLAAITRRSTHADGCAAAAVLPAPGAALQRWTLDPPVPDAVLLRVYESGSYHLVDGSLRYRRGAGGRQPLTADVFDPARSGVRYGLGDTTVVLTLHGVDGRGGGWARTLFGNGGWPR